MVKSVKKMYVSTHWGTLCCALLQESHFTVKEGTEEEKTPVVERRREGRALPPHYQCHLGKIMCHQSPEPKYSIIVGGGMAIWR